MRSATGFASEFSLVTLLVALGLQISSTAVAQCSGLRCEIAHSQWRWIRVRAALARCEYGHPPYQPTRESVPQVVPVEFTDARLFDGVMEPTRLLVREYSQSIYAEFPQGSHHHQGAAVEPYKSWRAALSLR